MKKTWSITTYEDGKPAETRHGVSHGDAVVELYNLSRGCQPPEIVAESRPQPDTRELELVAA